MNLYDLVDPHDFAAAQDAKLIGVREAGDGQRVLNYTDAAMYTTGSWDNPAVRACRGLIVDELDNIVARPWTKFFNYGQAEADTIDMTETVQVSDKMDGSLGIVHRDAAGRARVATRGSFGSEQAIHATELLRARGEVTWPEGFTPLVEIVYPANRIVCDYGDRDTLIMLGGVWNDTGTYVGPHEAAELMSSWPDDDITTVFQYATLRDALAAEPRPGAEGMVVRAANRPAMVKIKQADYIALHKIVTGLSERGIWERMLAGDTLADLLTGIPDELHPWIRQVHTDITGRRDTIIARSREVFTTLDASDRRTFALEAQQHPERPWLFMLLDGRDIETSVLKSLRPVGDNRPVTRSETTA